MLSCTLLVACVQDTSGHVVGARCVDKQSGKKLDVHAKVVINAAGEVTSSSCFSWQQHHHLATSLIQQ